MGSSEGELVASTTMGTLYDLLGALPGDDADGLRAAFRRAAKATHPDIHPDDPDAARRFRELVRAYDILTDRDQRTTYDQLLTIALHPAAAPKSTSVYETVRKLASNTVAATIITGVLIGGYTLFGFFSNAPGAAEILSDGATGQRAALAGSSEAALERTQGAPADSGVEKEAIVAAAYSNSAALPGRIANPLPGFALGNPLARRDPILAAGYLDREIMLYRAPRFDRAFDMMFQARRVNDTGRPKISATPPRKPLDIRIPEARIPETRVPLPPRRAPMIAALTP